jgi:transcriptional regulator with XRE-family HTH domain
MTMEALANEAEMEIRQLGRIEGGEINTTVSTVLALAKALNMDISELFKFPYKK